jgi:hypothetical protein
VHHYGRCARRRAELDDVEGDLPGRRERLRQEESAELKLRIPTGEHAVDARADALIHVRALGQQVEATGAYAFDGVLRDLLEGRDLELAPPARPLARSSGIGGSAAPFGRRPPGRLRAA